MQHHDGLHARFSVAGVLLITTTHRFGELSCVIADTSHCRNGARAPCYRYRVYYRPSHKHTLSLLWLACIVVVLAQHCLHQCIVMDTFTRKRHNRDIVILSMRAKGFNTRQRGLQTQQSQVGANELPTGGRFGSIRVWFT